MLLHRLWLEASNHPNRPRENCINGPFTDVSRSRYLGIVIKLEEIGFPRSVATGGARYFDRACVETFSRALRLLWIKIVKEGSSLRTIMLLYFQLSIVKSKVPFSVISSGKKLNDDCNLLEKREGKAQLPSWKWYSPATGRASIARSRARVWLGLAFDRARARARFAFRGKGLAQSES